MSPEEMIRGAQRDLLGGLPGEKDLAGLPPELQGQAKFDVAAAKKAVMTEGANA